MSGWRRRGAGAAVLAAVLAVGAVPVARDLIRSGKREISVQAYDRTDDPRVIVAHVDANPDFVVRVDTDEDNARAVLHVSARPPRPWWSGTDLGVPRTVRVRLDRPLAGRQVVDGHSRAPVPER